MDKSDIIKDIKRKTKDFLFFQDVKIKDIKFTD